MLENFLPNNHFLSGEIPSHPPTSSCVGKYMCPHVPTWPPPPWSLLSVPGMDTWSILIWWAPYDFFNLASRELFSDRSYKINCGGHVSNSVETWSAMRRNEINMQKEVKEGELWPRSGQLQVYTSHSLVTQAFLRFCKSSLCFLSYFDRFLTLSVK